MFFSRRYPFNSVIYFFLAFAIISFVGIREIKNY
jgi:hypothetical protein